MLKWADLPQDMGQSNEHSVCTKQRLFLYQLSGYQLRNKNCVPQIYLSSLLPRSQLFAATCIAFVIMESDRQLVSIDAFTTTLHQIRVLWNIRPCRLVNSYQHFEGW
jgi:hypothetical protein